jgi:DHA1 family multidrug resistance protein-like MFS transporter
MGFSTFTAAVLFMKETYPPTVLVSKAEFLRRSTKNWAIHAKQEEVEINIHELLSKYLSRPMRMFFTEPIVAAITIYLSFVYGILYTFLTAYPLVFQGIHGMKPGIGGLPFFGMVTGMILAGVGSILQQPAWVRKFQTNGGKVVPEWRLPYAAVGGAVFTTGLFC